MSRGRIGQEEAPKFTQPLKSVSVKEGQAATLQAEVKGHPEPTIKWFKDEKELKSSPKYNINFAKGKCSLKISKTSVKDDGQYKCTADNKSGNAMCSATLQVQGAAPAETEEVKPQQQEQQQQQPPPKQAPPPPQQQQPPPPQQAKPTAQEVPPPSSEPKAQQQQQQAEKQQPPPPPPQQQQPKAKPTPPPPQQQQQQPEVKPTPPPQQQVKVEVKLPGQPTQAKPPPQVQIVEAKMAEPTQAAPKPTAPPPPPVTSAPVFTKALSDIKVKEGDKVRLECIVKGQPQPEVKWYREGALVQPSVDFEISYKDGVCSLTIPEIFFDDAGQFACAASNSAGMKSTSCNVNVQPGAPIPAAPQTRSVPQQNAINGDDEALKKHASSGPIGPPEFVKPLLPVRFSEGSRCRLACQVKGNPAPKITWLRHGKPLESGYRFLIKYDEASGMATLDITMLLHEDKGEYTCVAKSKAGQVFVTAAVLNPAEYDHWAQEYAEQQAIEKAKKKKDIVNKELEEKVQQKGGKITPSQATFQPPDDTPKLSPFERRLMREVELRKQDTTPRKGPIPDQDSKVSPFESRLEKEIRFRERKSSQDLDATDSSPVGPFDVAAFEATLLQQPQPQESEAMEAETETELESELETEASQQRAPRFLKELKNLRVSEGRRLALSCRVEGRPKPSIQWYKNGRPLPKSTRYDLSYMEGFTQFRIDLVLPEDTGAYTIFAWNQFGKAVNTGLVKVDELGSKSGEPVHMRGAMGARVSMETEEYQIPEREHYAGEVREKHYKPTFKVIPSDLSVKEGKLARFNCRITGRPPPDLTWYRNEMPVYPDANHRVLVNEGGEHALMISYTMPHDSGLYTCVAKNRAGEAKFQVTLQVEPKKQLVAPSFIDRVENMTVRENEPVTLTCKVTGTPTPHVSWQRDQKHIMPNAGGYSMKVSDDGVCQLFIERVTRHDSAWYTCTAHNSAGRVSCRSRVQVVYDKLIRDNEPAPIFQRRPTQGKRPVPPQDKEEIPSYVTQFDDETDATKKSGAKPEFVVPLNDCLKKKEGDSAHFACRIQPAGDPTMRVDWLKNNTQLFIGSRVQTKYEFGICSLDIKGVYPEDAGTITCRATNKYGHAETSGNLTCEAQQSLILDTQLPEEMRGIEKTLEYDEYLSAGDLPDDSKFPSEEKCRPELVTVPEPVSVLEGENARFSCRVSGVPAPRVSWFREDLQIMGQGARMKSWFDGIHYMEITKARPSDSGVIRLVARNKMGMVEFKTKLEVQAKEAPPPQLKPTPKEEKVPPQKPKFPSLQKTQPKKPPPVAEPVKEPPTFIAMPPPLTTGIPGEPVRISCRIAGQPAPRVVWSKDGRLLSSVPRMKILQDGSIHTLLILECLPEDAGIYNVEISSPAGKNLQSFKIEVQAPPPGEAFEPQVHPQASELARHHPEVPVIGQASLPEFLSVLTDCMVPEGSPVELACEVTATPPPVINWYLNGAIIKPSRYFRMSYVDSVARLQIHEVFPEDQGVYMCEAFNNAGRVSCSGNLSVQGEWESEEL